ncbi:MAG TPA: hypothetical protein VJQ54_08905 [Candidatus Sulfotelmatobacter sp.]|nr:hypothetical protein [Candidatus Sulfotelmatobacter sp.]
MSDPATHSSAWKAACLLGAVSLFSFIYFYEGGGWNQNSRFDLLRAIVEQHTLTIDSYHENTEDKAHFRGHYYSDKAPGLVFLAVPFAVAGRAAMRGVGIDPNSPRGEFALSWIVTAASVALPAALASVCLFFLALRVGCDLDAAAFAVIAMSIGTPFWAYASLFWAHALVGACLLFGFGSALRLQQPCSAPAEWWWSLAVGLAAGWATVTEYPALPASALLALFALAQVWRRGRAARWRVLAGVGIGAGVCAVALFSYLHAAFGSFRPSYAYYDPNSFSFMRQQGYLGLTYPHPDRLLKLLFGCSRGIFFASPVLLAAPIGLWLLWKKQRSWAALLAGGVALYYFLFNASFYWWKAGLTFGPRYAGAAIPILCLGLAVCWQHGTVGCRRVWLALAAISVFITLMVVSTTSQLAMQDSCPIVHTSWPAFWSGKMAINRVSMLIPSEAVGDHGAANLGQLIGLSGLATLIPLLAIWGIAAVLWARIRKENVH